MKAEPIEVSVLGRTMSVQDTGGSLTSWLVDNWSFPEVEAAPYSFTIAIETQSERPRVPDSAPRATQLARLDGLQLLWQQHGERWWSCGERNCGVELQIHDDGARIRVWSAQHPSRNSNVNFALHIALCEALRASGLAPLHAAVIVREGRATALLGRSGTGKSSTLLHALQADWLPLAEDFAWLDLRSRTVYGWDRGVRLSAAAIRRVGSMWEKRAWQRQADGKFLVAYDQLGVQRLWSAALERVVLLERDGTRNSARELLAPREAVRALWEAGGLPLCPRNRAAFAVHAAKLLSTLEWDRLILGHTPVDLPLHRSAAV